MLEMGGCAIHLSVRSIYGFFYVDCIALDISGHS